MTGQVPWGHDWLKSLDFHLFLAVMETHWEGHVLVGWAKSATFRSMKKMRQEAHEIPTAEIRYSTNPPSMNSMEVEEIEKFTHVQLVENEPALLAKETTVLTKTTINCDEFLWWITLLQGDLSKIVCPASVQLWRRSAGASSNKRWLGSGVSNCATTSPGMWLWYLVIRPMFLSSSEMGLERTGCPIFWQTKGNQRWKTSLS